MASRLGQYLIDANLTLKALIYLLFIPDIFYLLFGCPMDNFWLLSKKQSHSTDVNHCVWAIKFWPKGQQEPHKKVAFLCLVRCLVGFEPGTFQFDHNALTHLAPLYSENTLPRSAPQFSIWKCPQYLKKGIV